MELIHKILPLVIKDRQGQILEVSLSNEKGFKKSLERGHLWHIHKETGRLLPYSEESLLNISEHKTWYEAILSVGKDHNDLHEQRDLFNSINDNQSDTQNEMSDNFIVGSEDGITNVIAVLEQLVLERKLKLPEGSYTTHLFESGAEKIRKKTGEEAIELILASSRGEIIYEAADLIYHMLVLLVSEDITFTEVLEELGNRAELG
ncbi:MAG: phosphoribosyl-ATP diphosphatase [Spirochaetaceae bacterium]|nr:phosphoribosyl-ATP diphosphatase [Spirochaetaceae bacterium]